jgi:hypothetical protein
MRMLPVLGIGIYYEHHGAAWSQYVHIILP